MSEDGRVTAVLDPEQQTKESPVQQPQVGGSPTNVNIRHAVHVHIPPLQQTPSQPIPQPQQAQGVFVPQRVYRGAIAAAAVAIALAGIAVGLLASWALYPQRTELVSVPDGRPVQEAMWQYAFAQSAVQTARALREAPASADSLRASDSLELALIKQDSDPWQAVLNAAHSAKTAEAALVQQAASR